MRQEEVVTCLPELGVRTLTVDGLGEEVGEVGT